MTQAQEITNELRSAGVLDTQELASLQLAVCRIAYKGIWPTKFLEDLSASTFEHALRTSLSAPGHLNLVVKRHGQIIGYLSCGPSRDADADPARTAEILGIYLLPEFWGKGEGQRLWSFALERLKERAFSDVTTWELDANGRAIKFFGKAGMLRDSAAQSTSHDGGVTLPRSRYRLALA